MPRIFLVVANYVFVLGQIKEYKQHMDVYYKNYENILFRSPKLNSLCYRKLVSMSGLSIAIISRESSVFSFMWLRVRQFISFT